MKSLSDFIQHPELVSGLTFFSHLARVFGKAMVKIGKDFHSGFLILTGAIFAALSIIMTSITLVFNFINDGYEPAAVGCTLVGFYVSTVKNLKTIFEAQDEWKKLRAPEPVSEDENGERRRLAENIESGAMA